MSGWRLYVGEFLIAIAAYYYTLIEPRIRGVILKKIHGQFSRLRQQANTIGDGIRRSAKHTREACFATYSRYGATTTRRVDQASVPLGLAVLATIILLSPPSTLSHSVAVPSPTTEEVAIAWAAIPVNETVVSSKVPTRRAIAVPVNTPTPPESDLGHASGNAVTGAALPRPVASDAAYHQ